VGQRPAVIKYDWIRLAQIVQVEVSVLEEDDRVLAGNVRIGQDDVALRLAADEQVFRRRNIQRTLRAFVSPLQSHIHVTGHPLIPF
jgi:hypothetical protein